MGPKALDELREETKAYKEKVLREKEEKNKKKGGEE
jgi:hypothetical protein